MSVAATTTAPITSRSPSELCRFIRNSDPTQLSLARLEQELLRNDILDQLRLTKRDGVAPGTPSHPLPKIQTIADRLGFSYDEALHLMAQYVRQRHTTAIGEPDLAALFSFYHQERCQLYLLIAVLLQTSSDAAHPYCPVARNAIAQCRDLFDAVLGRYRALTQVTAAPALPSPDLVRLWADDVIQQQALLLQVVLAHLRAFRWSPSAAQVGALLDLYVLQQLSGGWPLYTLLSAEGRRLSRAVAALWLQVFLGLMQLPALSARLSGNASAEFDSVLGDPLALDERVFARLPPTLPESGPMALSWAVYLCLTYQCLDRGIALPGTDTRHIPALQNRVLAHLSTSVRLDVFASLRDLLGLIDADHQLDIAAVLTRVAYHDLLSALARSDIQNVVVRALPDYYDTHLAPLYISILDGNGDLSERVWAEIEQACQDEMPSPFPLFDNAFRQFHDVVATLQAVALPSLNFAGCKALLQLLSAMTASPEGADRALRVLEAADPACLKQLQALFGRTVSAGLLSIADGFLLEFAKFTLRVVSQGSVPNLAVMLPADVVESVCIALHSAKLDCGRSANGGSLVETLLGLLCHVPRYDAAFNRQLQRYEFPDLAHVFLYQVDVASGEFRCTNHVVRLLKTILQQSEVDLHFPLDDYAHLCNRLIDFVCNDVFVIYDSWRFSNDLARWALGESIFDLFASLLASDDLRSQLLLRGQIGHRLALRLCNESAMQRVLFHPILVYKDRLEFGGSTRVKDAVSVLISAAFRVVQSLLSIRVAWNGNEPALNESLIDTCFRSGLTSARIAQTIVLYLDLPEYLWARHAIVTLTLLVRLSSLMDRVEVVTIAGLLSQSRVVDLPHPSAADGQIASLTQVVARLLELEVAFLQKAVLEFIVTALQYQPGLAERLLEHPGGNLLCRLHQLMERKHEDLVVFEQAMSVFSQLWIAAVRYRSVMTTVIADRVVQDFGDRFWAEVAFAIKQPIATDSNLVHLASLRARSDAFQILSIEFAYASDPAPCTALIADVSFDVWLQDLTPTPEQWAALPIDVREALSDLFAKWKQFLNSVLLNAPRTLSKEMRLLHRSALISRVLSLEGVPLSVMKDAALLLVAIAYHTEARLSDDDLRALMRTIQLHAGAFETCTRIRSPDLPVYALICDSIMSVFNMEAIRHGHCNFGSDNAQLVPLWADDVVRIAARLAAFDQTGFLARQLPGLIQCSSLNAVSEVVAAVQSLSTHLLPATRSAAFSGDGYSRLKIFLMFIMSISVHPRGSDVLLSIGVLSTISNSWLRTSMAEVLRRHAEIWCLVLDIATALLIASPTSQQLRRQIVEFAVVFRTQLQCSVKLPLDAEHLLQVQRCVIFCYEIGHIPGRFREMPNSIIQEQRLTQCQTCFALSRQITLSMYSPPQHFGCERWLILKTLSVSLAFLRSQQARNLVGLFSFDLSARAEPEPGSPLAIAFVVDLIDYCVSILQSEMRTTVPFIKERLASFDQLHMFILEHCLLILMDFMSYHICSTAGISPYISDYLQEIVRIRRSLESAQVLADSDSFLNERIMGPMSALESELQRLIQRDSTRSSVMELDASIPFLKSQDALLS